MFKVWVTISLTEADHFTAPLRYTVILPDGTVVETGTGIAAGTGSPRNRCSPREPRYNLTAIPERDRLGMTGDSEPIALLICEAA